MSRHKPDIMSENAPTNAAPSHTETAIRQPAAEVQLVCFRLAGATYGVLIEQAVEVVKDVPGERTADTPAHLAGFMAYRGETIPVIDLRQRLGLPEREPDGERRTVVIHLAGNVLGLEVDEITEVLRGERRHMTSAAPGTPDYGHLAGVYDDGVQRVAVLDCRRLPTI